ncbi:lipocalin family protein [Flavivirga amylovorans]|uniref:Lipocalin family protein n=1 Tax=Flavivirga amylovorans TaxID=870486 RepID=A0ABT8WX77_9FLAO|nr:lipocalin family protein [Flavivirga amylovorans]MDO5986291.1 lipocalin family protein [Flavivirga amylovorans]
MILNKNTAIVLLVLLSLFVNKGFSQEAVDTNFLTGTWIFNYESSKAKVDIKTKERIDNLKVDDKTKFEEAYKNRKLTFNADGTFTQQLSNEKSISGTWVLNNKDVVLTMLQGNTKAFKIKKLSATSLVLKHENKGKSKMMLAEWNFTKI